MSALANWVRATTATTGTGSLMLSAVSGYPAPASIFGIGERFFYSLLDDTTGVPIEAGVGYITGLGTMVRELIYDTFVGGTLTRASTSTGLAPVSLAGTTRVIITPIAEGIVNSARASIAGPWGQAGDWQLAGNVSGWASGTLTPAAANRLYAFPVLLDFRTPFDSIRFFISSAGGTQDVGIYTDANGKPGTLLVGWQGATTVGYTANVLTTANSNVGSKAGASAVFAPPGWYWLLFNHANGTSYNRVMTTNPTLITHVNGDPTVATTCLQNNPQAAGVLPSAPTFNSIGTIDSTSGQFFLPLVLFRRSA